MFHRVRVPLSDASGFRFLWRRPGSSEPVKDNLMQVQIFGVVSSPSACAYALRKAAADGVADAIFASHRKLLCRYLAVFLWNCLGSDRCSGYNVTSGKARRIRTRTVGIVIWGCSERPSQDPRPEDLRPRSRQYSNWNDSWRSVECRNRWIHLPIPRQSYDRYETRSVTYHLKYLRPIRILNLSNVCSKINYAAYMVVESCLGWQTAWPSVSFGGEKLDGFTRSRPAV